MDILKLENLIRSDYGNTAGMVVLQDGETVCESYFNGCTAADAVHVFSVTKSVFSTLIGIAMDKGYIGSIDQNVFEFFPEYAAGRSGEAFSDVTI